MPRALTLVLLTGFLTLAAQAAPTAPGPATAPATQPQKELPDLHWSQLFHRGDHILFVGDDITQQMYYDRAATAALLAVMPDRNLRFFNGGKDGATARSAQKWIGGLLDLTRPQIVFIMFGLNDGVDPAAGRDPVGSYARALTALVQKVRAYAGVRQVIILSPPAVQPGLNARLDGLGYNDVLRKLAQTARQVAIDQHVGFIGLFEYTHFVFDAASKDQGESLSWDGRLPNDMGHVIIASVILRGLGLTPKELTPIAWEPLMARRMARIRTALAIHLPAPSLEASEPIQALFALLERYDEKFFRAWRIAGTFTGAPPRGLALSLADGAWAQVNEFVRHTYGAKKQMNPGHGP